MEKYDPERMELSTRDVVARAINQEVNEGRGSPHGGAYLDISHKPAEFVKRKLPSMYEQFHKLADVDITKEAMEVAPTIHYAMSGVRVEPETGASSIEGLFAAGEVSCGLHGANRLGGNSLSDLLVFGKRAGDGAAAYASNGHKVGPPEKGQVVEAINFTFAPLERSNGSAGAESPFQLHAELQDVMTRYAPIIREEKGLKVGLGKVIDLVERAGKAGTGGPNGKNFNPGWHAALDLQSMVNNAQALFLGAIERRESRGAHSRSDYPNLDEELGKVNFVVSKSGREMKIDSIAKEPVPGELVEVIEAKYTQEYTRED